MNRRSRLVALTVKELREGRPIFIGAVVVTSAIALVLPMLYDTMVRQLAGIGSPDTWPPFLAEALELLRDFPTFLWSQWYAKTGLQVGSLAAIILGAGSLAREFETGTAQFLLSRPVTRAEVVAAKALAAGAHLAGMVVLSTAAALAGAALAGKSFPLTWALAFSVANLAGFWVVLGLATLASGITREVLKAAGLATAVAMLLSVPGLFRATRELSVFFWMRGGGFVAGTPFPWLAVVIMLGAATGLFFLVHRLVARTDV